jgi:hypothetical protein
MFFAHHNDACDLTKLQRIHLDLVVVKKGKFQIQTEGKRIY